MKNTPEKITAFKYGTMSQYLKIDHDPDTLYYITDKVAMFIGDRPIQEVLPPPSDS
ncbi:MAG: hypothetical protein Q4F82_07025 [bacterium]|nr:hypothetical protein [bacterium]